MVSDGDAGACVGCEWLVLLGAGECQGEVEVEGDDDGDGVVLAGFGEGLGITGSGWYGCSTGGLPTAYDMRKPLPTV